MKSDQTGRAAAPASPKHPEEMLSNFPLLAELDSVVLRKLTRSAQRYDLPHGQSLFRQGTACPGLHLVASGRIKLSIQAEHGSERVIDLVGPGESLGELALLMSQPYMMSAEAVADSSIVQLAADAVFDQIQHNRKFLRSLLREVCVRLNRRNRDLESHLLLNGTQRVIGYLLSQLPRDEVGGAADTITLPAKKSIIASRLNVTQEHFSRVLRDIQTAGLIEVSGREIRLTDVARLRDFRRPTERARRTQT